MDEPGRIKRSLAVLRRLDSGERLVALARAGRRRLPGDHAYGDPLKRLGGALGLTRKRALRPKSETDPGP